MEKFPHLRFVQKITGKPRLHGGGEPNPQTEFNKNNRGSHYGNLSGRMGQISAAWSENIELRANQELPPLDGNVVPIFLQINPEVLGTDFDLKAYGIEVISQEDNGYIIGASIDGLNALNDKITRFLNNQHGGGQIANLWQIIEGTQWKPEHILSEELFKLWPSIEDDAIFRLDVGIAFDKPLGKEPDPTKKGGVARLQKYHQDLIDRDEKMMEREDGFDEFIAFYGERKSSFVDLDDSFSCEIEITGKGLRDLVMNYPFVFEVSEVEEIKAESGDFVEPLESEFELIPPDEQSPEIGVIDSGIMEEHRYLSDAIFPERSKSYVVGSASTADHVPGGGHGTRVAGAILYPQKLPEAGEVYQLPCFIRNLRVLDDENLLQHKYPAELMKEIVNDNEDCKVYNLSINSLSPYKLKHMSSWAATIDSLIFEKDVLFVLSAGNIPTIGIQNFLRSGTNYPDYLFEANCRVANPGQSSFALTVGSVNHTALEDDLWRSIGNEHDASAFSRTGTGIWGMIKPDVVEFGGGLVMSKIGTIIVNKNIATSPQLIRSTLHGGNAYGNDKVGTSFSTPKVSHIVAQLLKLYPEDGPNLLRALVAQGARLPKGSFENPTAKVVKCLGYGLPSLERVTKNTDQRITFYSTGNIEAEEGHIYSLRIPEFLRSPAEEYDILIEVTLAYTAKIRRTRQRTKSYLATWVDWTTSKNGEPFDDFKDYALKEIDDEPNVYDAERRNSLPHWNWKIKSNTQGNVEGISRSNSTLQKDWTIIKSHDLPEEFGFAVRGHKGWDKNGLPVPYSLVVSIEILNSNLEIYDPIRIENELEIEV